MAKTSQQKRTINKSCMCIWNADILNEILADEIKQCLSEKDQINFISGMQRWINLIGLLMAFTTYPC